MAKASTVELIAVNAIERVNPDKEASPRIQRIDAGTRFDASPEQAAELIERGAAREYEDETPPKVESKKSTSSKASTSKASSTKSSSKTASTKKDEGGSEGGDGGDGSDDGSNLV